MTTRRVSPPSARPRLAAVAVTSALLCGGPASAASVGSAPPPAKTPDAPRSAPSAAEADASSRNTVARARMLECGHQWNNMKRAGTASGTWKDFSRGCLAQR